MSEVAAQQDDVIVDTPCRKCAYNLRGLSAAGRCPECGAPIGASVHGNFLRFSPPPWLDTLARGANWSLAGMWAFFATILLQVLSNRSGFVAALGALGTSVLFIIGGWMLTEPDPSGLGENKYGTARRIIRVGLIVSAADALVGFSKELGAQSPELDVVWRVVSVLTLLVSVVAHFAQLRYLGHLAVRVPDWQLESRANFLMWAFAICGAMLAAGIGLLSLTSRGERIVLPLVCGTVLALLALAVFSVMYMLMLAKFARVFREAEYAAHRACTSSSGFASRSRATAE